MKMFNVLNASYYTISQGQWRFQVLWVFNLNKLILQGKFEPKNWILGWERGGRQKVHTEERA